MPYPPPILPLAASDSLTLALFGGTLLVQAISWIATFNISRRQRRMEGLEDKVERIDKERHQVVTQLVDERFRSMSHEVANSVQSMVMTLDMLKAKVDTGEITVRDLSASDNEIRLAAAKKDGDFKSFVLQHTINRDDFKEITTLMRQVVSRIDKLETRMDAAARRDC